MSSNYLSPLRFTLVIPCLSTNDVITPSLTSCNARDFRSFQLIPNPANFSLYPMPVLPDEERGWQEARILSLRSSYSFVILAWPTSMSSILFSGLIPIMFTVPLTLAKSSFVEAKFARQALSRYFSLQETKEYFFENLSFF